MRPEVVLGLVKIRERGYLDTVFFDFDDTIGDSTPGLWGVGFWNLALALAKETGADPNLIFQSVVDKNTALHREIGVHPRKYPILGRMMADELGVKKYIVQGLVTELMRTIFWGIPELYQETPGVLDEFLAAVWKRGVGTHSTKGRLKRIRDAHKLGFPVVTQSTHGVKNEKIWIDLASLVGSELAKTVICGDSLQGDVLAGIQAGAGLVVWVEPKWAEAANGKVPKDQIIISGIGELGPALIRHFGVG